MKPGMEFWAGHVASAKLEAISASEYAKRHGISVAALYYWQRKLKHAANMDRNGASSKFVSIRIADSVVTNRSFSCSLVLPSGIRLEMSSLPEPEWLVALGHASPGAH